MRSHREMPWLWRSLVSIACSLPASACVDAVVGEIDVCEYEGESHGLNDKFTAKDGCNTCKCTIEGEVECTELACPPVVGCDEEEGCRDAGMSTPKDAGSNDPACDPKLGCFDAGSADVPYCKLDGKTYKAGESFRPDDGCTTCTCAMIGEVHCDTKSCLLPDGGYEPSICIYESKVYKLGDTLAAYGCNNCVCAENGTISCSQCTSDAGSYMPVPGMGFCTYGGKTYRVGEGFDRGDNCNKCSCVSDGLIECTSNSCAAPPGCLVGNKLVPTGTSITCDDGCNTCRCQMDGKFSRTERACPALPAIRKCDGSASALQIPAALQYLSGDTLSVSESRCVNGQANDFSLCYEDLASTMGNEATVFMVAGSGTRACGGGERVYSLIPLRDDYLTTFSGRTGGKVILRGTGNDLLYQFGM